MARGTHARRWKDQFRLLRELSAAARSFSQCRRRNRTGALKRYLVALHQFTNQVVCQLPERLRMAVNASAEARKGGRRRALRRSSTVARRLRSRLAARSMTRPRAEHAGDTLDLRMASELSLYVGMAGANRIMRLAANNGADLPAAAKSILSLFVGQTAASLLVNRIVDQVTRA